MLEPFEPFTATREEMKQEAIERMKMATLYFIFFTATPI